MNKEVTNKDIPVVTLNNQPINNLIPLTTEEPIRRKWLRSELEDINKDENNEGYEDESSSSESSSEDSDEEDSMIEEEEESNKKNEEEEEMKRKNDDSSQPKDIMAYLQRELMEYQERQEGESAAYEQRVAEAETEEDILEADPELLRRTESNRYIPYDEASMSQPKDTSSNIHSLSNDPIQQELLVFADNPAVIEDTNKLSVIHYYGAGKNGILPMKYRIKRKTKSYLVACDFSKESIYAIEWTMGTMMRDGDELHIATISNREDNPDIVKATGLDPKGELHATSNALIKEAKKLMGQMMLFNVKLVTHVLIGHVKDCLKSLTREHEFTMLICGSRGRSSMRKLLMGSVSTYLVHKSPVPVAVIRRQKKKKKTNKNQPLEAHALSESVKTGQLVVDELSNK
ncbi:uncharacterized protein BX663DRAFT_513395 [Cokeromyces recurvatus]|uniref:uncharacterized protein n=1 Tax=Cokeromyces recurvatus TaxID=90255 RepID=UPI0022203D85|nr:uncharacterized protein BX663DRAFT_513395 [Cokeromyces recurvatus]KAI7901595.1 hypothetical protein BX663DRAFT_513395 [Cokeromyces recurvatus]